MASIKKPKRKALTKRLERQIIVEAGGKCPWCNERVTAAEIEIHHIDEDRSNNVPDNLILTCRNHHGQIGAKLIPQWEVIVKKQLLCNPTVAERLGLVAKLKPQNAGATVNGDNYGINANEVKIEKVNFPRGSKGKRAAMPGLIEADADMRTYADYLVKRYIKWRKSGQVMDGRRFSPGSAHGILAEGFGSPSSVFLISQGRFFDWVARAQAKIDRTPFGRQNSSKGNRNYHTWEEHLAQRHGPKPRRRQN